MYFCPPQLPGKALHLHGLKDLSVYLGRGQQRRQDAEPDSERPAGPAAPAALPPAAAEPGCRAGAGGDPPDPADPPPSCCRARRREEGRLRRWRAKTSYPGSSCCSSGGLPGSRVRCSLCACLPRLCLLSHCVFRDFLGGCLGSLLLV